MGRRLRAGLPPRPAPCSRPRPRGVLARAVCHAPPAPAPSRRSEVRRATGAVGTPREGVGDRMSSEVSKHSLTLGGCRQDLRLIRPGWVSSVYDFVTRCRKSGKQPSPAEPHFIFYRLQLQILAQGAVESFEAGGSGISVAPWGISDLGKVTSLYPAGRLELVGVGGVIALFAAVSGL